MSIKPTQLIVCISFWLVLSFVLATTCAWWERSTLEKKFGLPQGVIWKFRTSEIELTRPNGELETYPYRIFAPTNIDDEGSYPVVLYLHGSGERGFDNARQLKSVPAFLTMASIQQQHPCFVVVPQCPQDMSWDTFRRSVRDEFSPIDDPMMAILEQVYQDPRADRERTYLIGFSMGSFGSWTLAADFPNAFAAVVPIAGGGSARLADSLVNVPIWAVHGDEDRTCPVSQTREIIAKLSEIGGDVHYSELRGVGHASWLAALETTSEVLEWMFRQKRTCPKSTRE